MFWKKDVVSPLFYQYKLYIHPKKAQIKDYLIVFYKTKNFTIKYMLEGGVRKC